MGGMAAQIPIKNDPAANEQALEKVRQDKLREVRAGHDGTWVAHPGLVSVAKEIFDSHMPGPNQLRHRTGAQVSAADLLAVPDGDITEAGLRWNIDVGIQYLEAWMRGNGCVPIYNLMEDAATAEICRAQVWQWVRHGAKMNDGRTLTTGLVKAAIADVAEGLRGSIGGEQLARAAQTYEQMMTSADFPEFLTLVAYESID
jgi:malate synthase